LELENSFDEELKVELSSSLLIRSETNLKDERNKLSIVLQPK